jgi:hypothetical protein
MSHSKQDVLDVMDAAEVLINTWWIKQGLAASVMQDVYDTVGRRGYDVEKLEWDELRFFVEGWPDDNK